MDFCHHCDRGAVPPWHRLFLAVICCFIMNMLHSGFSYVLIRAVGGVVDDIHRSTAGAGTGEMLML